MLHYLAHNPKLTTSEQKCDGQRPTCTPCAKSHRPVECAYEEKKPPNRTQVLESRITRLEAKLRDLESNSPQPSTSTSALPSISSPSPSATSSPNRTFSQTPPNQQWTINQSVYIP